MKRSDLYIRLTTGVLFLAVASYISVYVFNAVVNTYVTTVAISYTIEETFSADGFIVRTETVLTETGAAVLPYAGEGEKVAAGQVVVVEYTNREALETASELRWLRMRVAQLEAAERSDTSTARLESVFDLSRAVQSGDLGRLDEISLSIETIVFAAYASELELPELRSRLEVLEQRDAGVRSIRAPVSGTFSQVIDGFEHVSPEFLAGITPEELDGLFSSPFAARGSGKLVTEFQWYYAAVMAEEDAVRLSVGRRVPVQFSGAFHAMVEMLVESIGPGEDGFCVVVFSSDRGIHDVVSLRQLQAEVLYNAVSGIRVPKEAIHLDEDATTFVFLQSGVRAERVNVDILRLYGDSYLVRDGVEANTPLRAGSTIIVRANNLYHGKVVA